MEGTSGREVTDYLGLPGLLGLVSLSLFNQKVQEPRKRVDQDEPIEAHPDLAVTDETTDETNRLEKKS